MTPKIVLAKLSTRTHDSLDDYEVHKSFQGDNALTEALEYWKDNNCHRWGAMALLVEDEYSVVTLKLSRRIFEEMELVEMDEAAGD